MNPFSPTNMLALNPEIISIAQAIASAGGKSLLVGGSVRDHFLKAPLSKDFDVEVYHLPPASLEKILNHFGSVSAVGKKFGVFKLSTASHDYDFSFPRTENKIGAGHKGFRVALHQHAPFELAAARRDFTINALGYDILSGEVLDPFHGLADLQSGILRHVGPAFGEDPLRVLRGMQFAARFEFKIAPETLKVCQSLNLAELPKERICEEFRKLFLKAKKPSLGLQALQDLAMLKFFPEMKALQGVPQDPQWHPEGDVWTHTLMVVDEAAKLRRGEEKWDFSLLLGALCHDFGKPATTVFEKGRWRSPAHDVKGLPPTESFLNRLTQEQTLIDLVKVYVKEHLKPALLYHAEQVGDGAIRRLAMRVSIPDLVQIAKADHFGRTTPDALARQFPAGEWLLQRAERLQVHRNIPQPMLKGRHLLQLGMEPGPLMGKVIQESFELQLDGKLHDLEEVQAWAENRLKKLASSSLQKA